MTEVDERPPATDIDTLVAAEIKRLRAEGQLEVRSEQRCRVCADVPTRTLINNLLARMLSYRDIHQIIDDAINPVRKQRGARPITQRIIKHHATHHFAIDNPAWAIFRKIGEKRGAQFGRDYENGIAQQVTHLAFLETMVTRGWEDLIDPQTKVPYTDGARAAVQLAEIEVKTAGAQQQAEMMAELNRIIGAVKEVVPAEMWEAITAKMSGEAIPAPVHVPSQRVGDDDDDDEFDPGTDEDFDDEDEK